jgi:Bacterial Ig-like domain (group 2)
MVQPIASCPKIGSCAFGQWLPSWTIQTFTIPLRSPRLAWTVGRTSREPACGTRHDNGSPFNFYIGRPGLEATGATERRWHMRIPPTILTALALTLSACGGSGSTGPVGRTPTLSITLATNPIMSGTSVQASATITDASGNVSPATGVTWSSTVPSVADVNASGMVTGGVAGNATISAAAGGVTGGVQVVVTPGAPATVSIYSGDGQSGSHGSQLPAPLCVLVKDAHGNVVPGVMATYSVATGGGTLGSPTAPLTDGIGVATSGLWSLGSLVGQQTVLASVSGAGSVTFKATAQ